MRKDAYGEQLSSERGEEEAFTPTTVTAQVAGSFQLPTTRQRQGSAARKERLAALKSKSLRSGDSGVVSIRSLFKGKPEKEKSLQVIEDYSSTQRVKKERPIEYPVKASPSGTMDQTMDHVSGAGDHGDFDSGDDVSLATFDDEVKRGVSFEADESPVVNPPSSTKIDKEEVELPQERNDADGPNESNSDDENNDDDDQVYDANEKEITEMLDHDFPDLGNATKPDLYKLVSSAILMPCYEDESCGLPNAEWHLRNWVEFHGPDQEWHLATIAKVHEEENEIDMDVLQKVEETLKRTEENTQEKLDSMAQQIDKNAALIMQNTERVENLRTNLADQMSFMNLAGDSGKKLEGRVSPNSQRKQGFALKDILDQRHSSNEIDNTEYYYDCGYHYKRLQGKFIRSPEEGLRAIFGDRPWLWQQYALLRFEEKVRFQEGHVDDFENLSPVEFAEKVSEQVALYGKFEMKINESLSSC